MARMVSSWVPLCYCSAMHGYIYIYTGPSKCRFLGVVLEASIIILSDVFFSLCVLLTVVCCCCEVQARSPHMERSGAMGSRCNGEPVDLGCIPQYR